jgi:hypothetical protein
VREPSPEDSCILSCAMPSNPLSGTLAANAEVVVVVMAMVTMLVAVAVAVVGVVVAVAVACGCDGAPCTPLPPIIGASIIDAPGGAVKAV